MLVLLAFGVILIVSIILLYPTAVYHASYWRRRGVPGPPSRPFTGNFDAWFCKTPIALKLQEWSKQYGKTYGVQEGWLNVLVTSDPQLLHELFVQKFEYFHGRKVAPTTGNVDTMARVNVFIARGARWKRLRAIANSVFSVNNLKKVLPIMHDSTRVMMSYFEEKRSKGETINAIVHFHELSMDVIMRVALGQNGSLQFRNVEWVNAISKFFTIANRTNFHYYGRIMQPIAGDTIHHLARAYAYLTNSPFVAINRFVEKEVMARKAQRALLAQNDIIDEPSQQVDFIDLFLDLEHANAVASTAPSEKIFDKSAVKVSRQLTVDEVTSQCFVFLLAGFDTTANSLAATCHYLARNEEAQIRLRDEILTVCGHDEDPTYEQLNQLRYTDAVIKEALRLCPIASSVCSRECFKTTTLGDYTIEEGTIVQADVFTLQRDKTVWGEDADEFRPDRWLEEGSQARDRLSWMPFGAGPRMCVGMRLAYLEEKLALVSLLRTYAIRTTPQSEKTMNLQGDAVLSPENVIIELVKLE